MWPCLVAHSPGLLLSGVESTGPSSVSVGVGVEQRFVAGAGDDVSRPAPSAPGEWFLGKRVQVGEGGALGEITDVWVGDPEDFQAAIVRGPAAVDAAVGVDVAVLPIGREDVVLADGVLDVGICDFSRMGWVREVDQRGPSLEEGLTHEISGLGRQHGTESAGAQL